MIRIDMILVILCPFNIVFEFALSYSILNYMDPLPDDVGEPITAENLTRTFRQIMNPDKSPKSPGHIPKNSQTSFEKVDDASTASPSSAREMSPMKKQLREQDMDRAKEVVHKWMRTTFGETRH